MAEKGDKRWHDIGKMAVDMPLAYTAGCSALASWITDIKGGHLTLFSLTEREIAFYLGPARRVFGDPKDPLQKKRGRVAILIHRHRLINENTAGEWDFSPFDLGEITYHWDAGKILDYYLNSVPVKEEIEQPNRWKIPIDSLREHFREFLRDGYEDPRDYLQSWKHPRPSHHFPRVRNEIYKAAANRWFGRVRPFAPAWTYEVRYDPPENDRKIRVPLDQLMAMVVIDDPFTRELNEGKSVESLFREVLGDRLHICPMPESLHRQHPDLTTIMLEAETATIIRKKLELGEPRE